MLDKLSKRIVRYMQTSTDTPSETVYTFSEDLPAMAEALSKDEDSIRAALRFLERENYIAVEDFIFYLDHKGLNRHEFDRIEFYDFMRKSILTPIVVAFFTTILTNHLWPKLLHWLQALLSATQ